MCALWIESVCVNDFTYHPLIITRRSCYLKVNLKQIKYWTCICFSVNRFSNNRLKESPSEVVYDEGEGDRRDGQHGMVTRTGSSDHDRSRNRSSTGTSLSLYLLTNYMIFVLIHNNIIKLRNNNPSPTHIHLKCSTNIFSGLLKGSLRLLQNHKLD